MESKKSSFLKFIIKNILAAIAVVTVIILITLFWLNRYSNHGKYIEVPDFTDLTINEMSQLIEENNLRYKIIDSLFIPNKKRGVVINQNPQPGFNVKKNRNIFITINSIKAEIITMPNLVGLSMRQAKSVAERNGLFIKDLIYQEDLATNYVLDQLYKRSPIASGDKIAKGSHISIVCGISVNERNTTTPNLFNKNKKQAINSIQNASLNIGKIYFDNTVKSAKDSSSAKVWKQSPAFNNQLNLGTRINIWLTKDNKIIDKIITNQESEK